MNELTKKYLELNVSNHTDMEKDAVLEYKGLNLTSDIAYSQLNIFKFNIISDNYPTFLPKILNPSLNSKYKAYIPPNTDIIESQIGMPTIQNEDYAYFLTDWQITISHEVDGVKTWYNQYVVFPIEKKYSPVPIIYDDNGYVSEAFMLENKFFWGNSEMICYMITDALYKLLPILGSAKFVKNGNFWSLLLQKTTAKRIEVYFNQPMMRLFKFNYNYVYKYIDTMRLNTTTLDTVDYYVYTTMKPSTKLFPFRKIIFTYDNGLNAFPYFVSSNSDDMNTNPIENILTSYSLNIVDINEVGDCIEYAVSSDDRSISLTNAPMRNFKIKVLFITHLGSIYQVKLENSDSVDMLIMFS